MSHDTEQTDQILEQLRPRMRSARVNHVRRLVAGVAVVPLLGISAAAMAANASDTAATQTAAVAPVTESVPEVELPEIGDPSEAVGSAEVPDDDAAIDSIPSTSSTTTIAVDEGIRGIDLGALGAAEIEELDDGSLAVVSTDFTIGWEVETVEFVEGQLIITISNGEQIMRIVIQPGVRDEIVVTVDEVIAEPPTTTTAKPPPPIEPTPTEPPPAEPPPPAEVNRVVVELPGRGSFVVERDGDTLFVGNVQTNEGYLHEVLAAEGWSVYVGFSEGTWAWYGKVYIDDNGQMVQTLWDEALPPKAVYQWVEVPGVGAAQFKALDGQIWVVEQAPGAGYGSWDYNEGAPSATAKVDFEGPGVLWIIDVWLNEAGEMVWSTTDASPA